MDWSFSLRQMFPITQISSEIGGISTAIASSIQQLDCQPAYCVLRPTQPPIHGGRVMSSGLPGVGAIECMYAAKWGG